MRSPSIGRVSWIALVSFAFTAAWLFGAPPEGRAAGSETGPWPADVKGFVPPKPGEHPRLLFRKGDLPELKRRAATPEGQAILKRLRVLLNGLDGESMPKDYNTGGAKDLPLGGYTMSHAAGFGLLYQLTGEKKYADLGRQCFEKAFEGVRDRDNRYSFRKPEGALRCGPSLGAYAIGYDLCCDGWDAEFRRKVVDEFMKYDEGPHCSLASCAKGLRQHPGSNHWGAEIGGPAMLLLAVKGDPGADDKTIDALLAENAKCFIRNLTQGFGDHGWFPEGDGPGTISSDTSFVPAIQAWRVAGGKDFVAPRPNAQWMTVKWVMQTVPVQVEVGQKPPFPIRGGYPHNVWARDGWSGSGAFCQGFGAITEEQKPALLWLYNHTFKAGDERAGCPCDTVSPYPHRAVLALVNWPFGMAEENPAKVLPKAVEDKRWAFCAWRNKWEGPNDIVITALLKTSKGNGSVPGGEIMVLGLGKKTTFPVKVTGDPKHFEALPSGGVVSTSAGSFGVDFSGASGADALLVLAGPVKGGKGLQTIEAGKNTFTIMTLQKGNPPQARAEGDTLVVGGQTVSYDGKKIAFAVQAE